MKTRDEAAAPVWGCVLIGGRSRRMGAPKHLLEREGRTWIEQTVAMLEHRVERVVIAGSGSLPKSLVSVVRVDDVPDIGGPLAGILAAFRRYPQVSWLVVACDLPDMNEEALQWLLNCRRTGVTAIMPELAGDGRIEPLLAYYDQSCRPLLEEMARCGHRRLSRLQVAAGVITPQPPASLRPCWRNVNTPEEICCPASISANSLHPGEKTT